MPVPDPGKELSVILPGLPNGAFTVACPDHFSLPSVPENVRHFIDRYFRLFLTHIVFFVFCREI
jgi:hypothetical protein